MELTLQTVFIMRINIVNTRQKKKWGKKRKRRGEKRKGLANIKVEKTDSNSAHTRTSEAVHT